MNETLLTLLQAVLIAAVPVLTGIAIVFLKKKSDHITSQINNETLRSCLDELSDAVFSAVAHTSSTYVDELKKSDKFDKSAQMNALSKAKDTALASLTPATREFLSEIYDNLDGLLETKVEQAVRCQKY